MAPRQKSLPAPPGYSWNMFLKTYRVKNSDNYPRSRNGNARLMKNAGKAWALFKEQAASAFTNLKYSEAENDDEMDSDDESLKK